MVQYTLHSYVLRVYVRVHNAQHMRAGESERAS